MDFPFGFTVPFKVAPVDVMLVGDSVEALGAAAYTDSIPIPNVRVNSNKQNASE